MRFREKRIGILTGGGDCPGLNAVIRAVTKTAQLDYGATVIGIEDGFEGLVEGRIHEYAGQQVSGILALGGTILGTSNKGDPCTTRSRCAGGDRDRRTCPTRPGATSRAGGSTRWWRSAATARCTSRSRFMAVGVPWSACPRRSTTTCATPTSPSASTPR